MQNLMKPFGGTVQDSVLDEAQELMYRAWESNDPVERIELAGQALQKSEDCADAWILLAKESAVNLPQALESNRYVPAYLTGRRKMPKYSPDYVGIGDKNEVVAYVFDHRQVWLDTPDTIPWLLKGKG